MPRQHVFCSFMVCNFYMRFSSGSSRRRREQRRPSESRPTSWAAPCLMYLQFCDRGSPASGGRRGCGPAAPPNRFSPCGGRRVIQNCLGRHKHWIWAAADFCTCWTGVSRPGSSLQKSGICNSLEPLRFCRNVVPGKCRAPTSVLQAYGLQFFN